MIRTFLFAFMIAIAGASVSAQDAAPLFHIERIEVRNAKRVSTDVVIAESRLREGQEYSEAALRDAATRLGRLPFLLSVDFALEKGSERGRHVLVLTVHETKSFFFLVDAVRYSEDNPTLDVEEGDDRGEIGSETLALGARWFVGRRGVLHVGLSGTGADREYAREYVSVALGYTQYDLFGTRAFATLNLKKPLEGYGEGLLSPQVVVGIPLTPNQTVTLRYDETRFAGQTVTILDQEYDERDGQRVVGARWSYNTTNEPFFPTRGTSLLVEPHYGWSDGAAVYGVVVGGDFTEVFHRAYHTNFFGVDASATRYHELNDRDSIWGNVRGDWARAKFRDDISPTVLDRSTWRGSVGVGYSHSLWSRERRANGGDSRIEVTARYSHRTPSTPRRGRVPDEEPSGYDWPGDEVRQFGAAWLRRTSWGTLRLGAGYAW